MARCTPSGTICSPRRLVITAPSWTWPFVPEASAPRSRRGSSSWPRPREHSSAPLQKPATKPRVRRFMADSASDDLKSLDREVALAVARLDRWRAASSTKADLHAEEDPLETVRHVASKSLWDALGRLPVDGADAPLDRGAEALGLRTSPGAPGAGRRGDLAAHGRSSARGYRRAARVMARGMAGGRPRSDARPSAAGARGSRRGWAPSGRDSRQNRRAPRGDSKTLAVDPSVGTDGWTPAASRQSDSGPFPRHDGRHRTLSAGGTPEPWSGRLCAAARGGCSRRGSRVAQPTVASLARRDVRRRHHAIGAKPATFARSRRGSKLRAGAVDVRLRVPPRDSVAFNALRDRSRARVRRSAQARVRLRGARRGSSFSCPDVGRRREDSPAQARLLTGTALLEARLHAARVLLGDDQGARNARAFRGGEYETLRISARSQTPRCVAQSTRR